MDDKDINDFLEDEENISDNEIDDNDNDNMLSDNDYDDIDSENDDIEKIQQINKNDDLINKDSINILSDDKINTTNDNNSDYDDDDDDDDDYDSLYQKFNKGLDNNFLQYYHPESNICNYMEINKLSNIVRDDNNNIIDDNHKTIPILSKYEKTKIIGIKAKQINNGNPPYITIPDNIIDGNIIAEMELIQKIPFIIRRPLPNRTFEYWKLKDLEIYY